MSFRGMTLKVMMTESKISNSFVARSEQRKKSEWRCTRCVLYALSLKCRKPVGSFPHRKLTFYKTSNLQFLLCLFLGSGLLILMCGDRKWLCGNFYFFLPLFLSLSMITSGRSSREFFNFCASSWKFRHFHVILERARWSDKKIT